MPDADEQEWRWWPEKQNRQQRTLGVTMKLFPSYRSLLKLIRDAAVVAFGAFAVYLGSNAADAGISAPVAAAIGPVALFVYRWLREAVGMGPDPAV